MTNRHILFSFIGLAVAAGIILFFYRTTLDNSSDYQSDINFNQIGNLTYNNPGMKPETWFLVYEAPGQPTLTKELRFDSASACAINAPAAPCDLSKLESGVRVRIEGRLVEETVLVRTIQLPEVIATNVPGTVSTSTTPSPTVPTGTGTKATSTSGTPTGTTTGTTTPSTPTNGLTVKLYLYNPKLDDAQCSRAGLVAVERVIQRTNTPLQDTIKLLLRGELSAEERAQGLTTEFPLSRVTLLSASNNNGVLTLAFRDPRNRTSGGPCRVSVMWSMIEATAKQFPGIETVRFSPDTLFQP